MVIFSCFCQLILYTRAPTLGKIADMLEMCPIYLVKLPNRYQFLKKRKKRTLLSFR